MALERRNSVVASLIRVVNQDQQNHYRIGQALHAMDFDKPTGEGGLLRGLFSMRGLTSGLIAGAIIGAMTTWLAMKATEQKPDYSDPTDPEKRQKSWLRRGTDWLGLTREDTITDGPVTPSPDGRVSIQPSPLTPSDTPHTAFRVKTAKASTHQLSAIAKASQSTGTDEALLYAVAGSESSFRNTVGAKTSSAQGLYQFTESTWIYLVKELRLDYTLEDRNDPQKSATVAGMYLNRIVKTLTKTLGRKPSYGETYLGYFMGPSGGSRFLRELMKDPKQYGASLFPQAAKANPNLFYDGGNVGSPLTLGQTLARLEGKVLSYADEFAPRTAVAQRSNPQSVQVEVPTTSSAIKTAASQPIEIAASKANATSAVAKSAATQSTVSVPSAAITNPRKQTPEAPKAPEPEGVPTKKNIKVSEAGSSEEAELPFRGKDGRLYQAIS